MERTPVTREELDRHLILIDDRLAHNSEKSDLKFNAIIEKMDIMTNQTAKVLDIVVSDVSGLKQNQATSNAYWKVSGAAIVLISTGVIGLILDRVF